MMERETTDDTLKNMPHDPRLLSKMILLGKLMVLLVVVSFLEWAAAFWESLGAALKLPGIGAGVS